MYNIVRCPFCNKDIDCKDLDFDYDNEYDYECDNCFQEFLIQREWEPSYKASKFIYKKCYCCEIVQKEDDMYYDNKKYYCRRCYFNKLVEKETRS